MAPSWHPKGYYDTLLASKWHPIGIQGYYGTRMTSNWYPIGIQTAPSWHPKGSYGSIISLGAPQYSPYHSNTSLSGMTSSVQQPIWHLRLWIVFEQPKCTPYMLFDTLFTLLGLHIISLSSIFWHIGSIYIQIGSVSPMIIHLSYHPSIYHPTSCQY